MKREFHWIKPEGSPDYKYTIGERLHRLKGWAIIGDCDILYDSEVFVGPKIDNPYD